MIRWYFFGINSNNKMIPQIVGYIKEIVVQFGSRMAIQPSSCETIVGMYKYIFNVGLRVFKWLLGKCTHTR